MTPIIFAGLPHLEQSYVLKDILNQKKHTPQGIIDIVFKYFKKETRFAFHKSQLQEHVLPRQISMYFIRRLCNLSDTRIAGYFSRDRTVVINSHQKICDLIQVDAKFKAKITEINALFL